MTHSTLQQGRKAVTALRARRRLELTATEAGARYPVILDLVERPYESVADARERLTELERVLYERGDGRASFLTVYARVTRELEAALEASEFIDDDWVAVYLVTFANHYRRAFYAYEHGDIDAVPDPWQLAFEAALRPETLVIQNVWLGINAHVNYDLALTLYEIGIDPERRYKARDHDAINSVLERLVDVQQEQLATRYAAGIAELDERLGPLDEVCAFFTLREGRRNAWFGAIALSACRFAAVRKGITGALNAIATGAGYCILSPGVHPSVLAALKDIESGVDVRAPGA